MVLILNLSCCHVHGSSLWKLINLLSVERLIMGQLQRLFVMKKSTDVLDYVFEM